MKRKLLTTTLLSMSLLSLNLSAAGGANLSTANQTKMKCTGDHCMVDLSNLAPSRIRVSNKQIKMAIKRVHTEGYRTVIIDGTETIVFDKEKYTMNDDEIGEYELENILHTLTTPALNQNNLPSSEHFCEDDLKPLPVVGGEDTYLCA